MSKTKGNIPDFEEIAEMHKRMKDLATYRPKSKRAKKRKAK